MGSYTELPKSLQRQGLINIKNNDNYCLFLIFINPCLCNDFGNSMVLYKIYKSSR